MTNLPLSERLTVDFGGKTMIAQQAVAAIFGKLTDPAVCTNQVIEAWQTVLATLGGQEIKRQAVDGLARTYRLTAASGHPAEMLLAVQTYDALLTWLVTDEVLASLGGRIGLAKMLATAPETVSLATVAQGSTTRELLFPGPGLDPYSWYLTATGGPIEPWLRRLAQRLLAYRAEGVWAQAGQGGDLLKTLYQGLFPRAVRHAMGEYYTPDWLAEHMLDEAGYMGQSGRRVLDPACGSGTFLMAALRRLRAAWNDDPARRGDSDGLLEAILTSVVGFDLHPLAVMTARANYLMAIADLVSESRELALPIFRRDSILEGDNGREEPFDYVVGNPPWIAWDDLPAAYREATKPLWNRYGLFTLSGKDARHGGGKKDLSMLMAYASADRHLRSGGRLAMVITQTLFQTKGAGDGFRRFRLGDQGDWLCVLAVNDLVEARPFDAANWTATLLLEKGSPTRYPLPYVRWSRPKNQPVRRTSPGGMPELVRHRMAAAPVDPDRPTSPWIVWPESLHEILPRLIGPADYAAHLGANTGGANGVYWVQLLGQADASNGIRVRNLAGRGKRSVEEIEATLEPDFLFPLLQWSDVDRYRAEPKNHLLLPQDAHARRGIEPAQLQTHAPRTYEYLERFRESLVGRAAYRRYQQHGPFYSMYDVGSYTLAPIKVVWRRMDQRIRAAVVEPWPDPLLGLRPVIPQETCVLVAVDTGDEAHYLAALLNSAPAGLIVTSHSVRGGKGFGSPGMLEFLPLGRYDPRQALHRELAQASRDAHRLAAQEGVPDRLQHQIDQLVARLWNLPAEAIEALDAMDDKTVF